MKSKKGFKREEVLIISLRETGQEFRDLFYKRDDRHHGYNRYWSEFDPSDKEDYSHTFTQKNLEEYWQEQIKTNNYKGSLEEFIKDYNLEMDVWFINCAYDFTGVKIIIINN